MMYRGAAAWTVLFFLKLIRIHHAGDERLMGTFRAHRNIPSIFLTHIVELSLTSNVASVASSTRD